MKRVITKHALAGGSDALLLRLLVGEDLIHQLGLFGQLAGEAGADIHVQHQRSAVALLGELLGGLTGHLEHVVQIAFHVGEQGVVSCGRPDSRITSTA